MTLATYEEIVDAEVVITDSDAEDFDARFQVALGTYAEARQELIDCIEFVRNTDIAERMGFKSRGDYIASRVAGRNVKWAAEDRRSLVELMSPTMSTRQVGNALGVSHPTVMKDMKSTGNNLPVERKVESSDGKTRTYTTSTDWPVVPEPTPEERFQKLKKYAHRTSRTESATHHAHEKTAKQTRRSSCNPSSEARSVKQHQQHRKTNSLKPLTLWAQRSE